MTVAMKGTRTVNEIVGLVIDPFNIKTWPPEQQRNHRLRRALHELLGSPAYTVEVGTRPDGSPGVRIRGDHVTEEAAEFLKRYREEFITYLTWLELIDEYSGVDRPVDLNERKAA